MSPSTALRLCRQSYGEAKWKGRPAHLFHVEPSQRQGLGDGATRRYRLSGEDPLGPVGFAVSASRPPRVSPEAPACVLNSNRVPWSR